MTSDPMTPQQAADELVDLLDRRGARLSPVERDALAIVCGHARVTSPAPEGGDLAEEFRLRAEHIRALGDPHSEAKADGMHEAYLRACEHQRASVAAPPRGDEDGGDLAGFLLERLCWLNDELKGPATYGANAHHIGAIRIHLGVALNRAERVFGAKVPHSAAADAAAPGTVRDPEGPR